MDRVQLFTFLFTLATFQFVLCDVNCSPDKHQFYFQQLRKCRPCDKCIVGEGTDENSEVKYDSKFGALTCKPCKPCDKGYFNRKRAYHCKPCRNCTARGRHTLRQCTSYKNTVCGDKIQQIVKISTESPRHRLTRYRTSTSKSLCNGCDTDNTGISDNEKNSKGNEKGTDAVLIIAGVSCTLVIAVGGVVFVSKKGLSSLSREGRTVNNRIHFNGYQPTESLDECTEGASPDEFQSLSSFSGHLSDANPRYQQIPSGARGAQADDPYNLNSPLSHSFPTLPSSNTDDTIASLSFDDNDTSPKSVDTSQTNGVNDTLQAREYREHLSIQDDMPATSRNEENGEFDTNFNTRFNEYYISNGEQSGGSVVPDPLSQQPLLDSSGLATAMNPHFNAGMDEDSPSSIITTASEVQTAGPKASWKQKLKTFIRQHSPDLSPNKKFIDVCRTLGVSDTDLGIIAIDFRDSVQEQAYRSLIRWTEKFPDACISQLQKALIKNNLGHIINQV